MSTVRNSVFLVGNLGRDPETRTFGDSKSVTNFSLATSESYENQKGERVTETQWHHCIIWGKAGLTAQQTLSKGKQVVVHGKLTYNEYKDQAGVQHRRPEIVVSDFYLVESNRQPVEEPQPA